MVGPYLLDVNVLLALAWPQHLHHRDAQVWFEQRRASRFATCPLTQLGFARLSSNPQFTKEAVTPFGALEMLTRITALPRHVFWPASLSCEEAFAGSPLMVGHRQVTDFYLVAIAEANGGVFATLDRSVPPSENVEFVGEKLVP